MTDRSKRKPQEEIKAKPCLPEGVAVFLKLLCTGADVFEFGSGGSTLWLAGFTKLTMSIEDDDDWFEAVNAGLRELGDLGDWTGLRVVPEGHMAEAIDDEGLWDVVFVDCLINKDRRDCILRSLNHIKPGGWLVADDYNFPIVKRTIDALLGSMWSTVIMRGTKPHPVTGKIVTTETAFCHKTVL